jgi:prolyl oligopeptidase
MHSHKLIAEMQHAAGGRSENPLLERVETRAGHGLGKPTSKLIDEAADVYGFMLHHLSHPGPVTRDRAASVRRGSLREKP